MNAICEVEWEKAYALFEEVVCWRGELRVDDGFLVILTSSGRDATSEIEESNGFEFVEQLTGIEIDDQWEFLDSHCDILDYGCGTCGYGLSVMLPIRVIG